MSEKFSDKLTRLIEGDDTAADGTAEVHGVEIPMVRMPKPKETIIGESVFRPGYTLQTVRIEFPHSEPFDMDRIVRDAGGYVGLPDEKKHLFERGILPELIPGRQVCSIGFCEAEQTWYGWSHRAMYGFGIGSEAKEGDSCTMSGWIDEYLEEHPEADLSVPVGFKAETLDDAKRMAVAFADSVS